MMRDKNLYYTYRGRVSLYILLFINFIIIGEYQKHCMSDTSHKMRALLRISIHPSVY